ncbi:MAG: hypothetical protein BJ554DRAFT_5675, partial [Olpidium bornovanus]
ICRTEVKQDSSVVKNDGDRSRKLLCDHITHPVIGGSDERGQGGSATAFSSTDLEATGEMFVFFPVGAGFGAVSSFSPAAQAACAAAADRLMLPWTGGAGWEEETGG